MKEELLLSPKVSVPRRYNLSIRLAEHKSILIVVDILLVLTALTLGLWFGARRSGWTFSPTLVLQYGPWFFGVTGLYFILATANDAYKPKVAVDPAASFVALLKTILEIFVLYLLLYSLLPPYSLPRHFIGFFAALSPFFLMVWRWLYHLTFAIPAFQRKALIVGIGWAGQTMIKVLKDFAPLHFEVVGFVDDEPAPQQAVIQGVPVLGSTRELARLAQQKGVTDIVLAVNHGLQGGALAGLLECHEQGIGVSTMPELYEHLTERVPVEHMGDQWFVMLPLDSNGQNLSYRLAKRCFDFVIAGLGLLLFALILPALACVIRLDSPGPIFYRQKRVGRSGREFELIKLRSMVENAEEDGLARWAEKNDQRITRIGLLLRQSRLDELPQLLNVLWGDMSLVGPRPERPEFVADLQQEIPFYRTRLTVKPGLTGWAQVNYDYGRSAKDALEKLRYDLYYIKHQSLHLDLIILLKTVGTILLLKGT